MLAVLIALVLGYLLGAFPSAALIAKLKGRHIFELGSGNMGAMNTARNVGWVLGVLVMLMDIGKGALAVYLAGLLASNSTLPEAWASLPSLVGGVGAVTGHAWSVYVGFKGGKALATTFGVSLMLYPVAGLVAAGLLVTLVLLLKRTALGSSIAVALLPLLVYTFERPALPQGPFLATLTSAALIAIIVIIKHVPALKEEREPRA